MLADIKPYRHQLLFLGISLLVYFLVFTQLNIVISDEILLIASDSQEYFQTGTEFYNIHSQGPSVTRPFLYPSLLRLFYAIGGAEMVWMIQFLAWTASAYLLFISLQKRTNIILAWIGGIIFISNISLINLTLFGLTEIFTVFLLCAILYVSIRHELNSFRFYLWICLILACLTVIKPLFIYPFLFWIFGVLPIFYFKQIRRKKKYLVYVLLASLPVIFQSTMMKIKYGSFEISTISDKTITRYWVAQGIAKIENIDRPVSIQKAESFSKSERNIYLHDNLDTYIGLLEKNLEENLDADPTLLAFPPETKHKKFYDFMRDWNKQHYRIFYLFIFLTVIVSLYYLIKKSYQLFFTITGLAIMNYYIIFSSAISFFQGDRLTIIAIPLTISIYCIVIALIVEKVNGMRAGSASISKKY